MGEERKGIQRRGISIKLHDYDSVNGTMTQKSIFSSLLDVLLAQSIIIMIKHGKKLERSAHCADNCVNLCKYEESCCSHISTMGHGVQGEFPFYSSSNCSFTWNQMPDRDRKTHYEFDWDCEKGLWTTTTRFTTFSLTNPQTLCVPDSRYIHYSWKYKKKVLSTEYWKACAYWYKPLRPHYRVGLHIISACYFS